MRSYLDKAFGLFDEHLSSTASPAQNSLFNIDLKSPKVNELKRFFFHNIAQLLLYAAY